MWRCAPVIRIAEKRGQTRAEQMISGADFSFSGDRVKPSVRNAGIDGLYTATHPESDGHS